MDSNNKRARPAASEDDSEDVRLAGDSPAEMKRPRRVSAEDYLFNILEDEEDGGSESPGFDDGDDGLASVMHSLEQEIRSGAGSDTGGGVQPEEEEDGGDKNNNEGSVQQLGYLLEASDDELGLPPAAEESPSPAALARDVAELAGAEMYGGGIWGFDEEIGFGSDLGGGFRPESADDGLLGLGFDDVGLFDHSEPSDLSWRTMPAV